jgi:hypothetical protein
MSGKDDGYIIDLCDLVLGHTTIRQHRFQFLVGDCGTRLPVDAYYPELKLVVEYHERQHDETVKFFDKPDKLTCSGVSRGEQRALYDQRRRDFCLAQNINLIELKVGLFQHNARKRLARNLAEDDKIVRHELAGIISELAGTQSQ